MRLLCAYTEKQRVLSVKVTRVFLAIKHATEAMIPVRSGSIISTASSCSAIRGACHHAYTCAKHAVVGLKRNAAVELGQFRIRVNCLSPYLVSTPLSRKYIGADNEGVEKVINSAANLKHVTLKTEDVANAALYLASDEERYVSGYNLLVDGGITIVNPSFNLFQYTDDHHR